ncbi:FadR family transcriptional regulator [Kribbella antibiotica]|uniref:FadR family transcriptional regulator n=1 Tax=Kribbella antibiotica TaxID=190195 RepID=A0A4R4ZR84_9ACTN|nr:FCD domain-containing protein [Kribbella antibiotica]TDD61473.1 FadR family transcriptional regulator [Kribbella antibiotica]
MDRYRPGYERVAEQLLQYLAGQDLRPGDRLPTEQGLADILGASRTVTREAIKILTAMGRLSVRRGAGIFVAASVEVMSGDQLVHFQPTDLDQVVMLLDHRRLLEAETARRAALAATPIEVRAIRAGALGSIDAAGNANINEFAQADAEFHLAVAAAAHNDFLAASVVSLRRYAAQSDLLLFHHDAAGSFEVAGAQHLAIAEAIAAGDPELAADRMVEHITTTRQQFERRIHDRLTSPR